MGGLQINYSSKLNVFAHYLLTSSAANFLLESNTHTLQGGIRLSLALPRKVLPSALITGAGGWGLGLGAGG